MGITVLVILILINPRWSFSYIFIASFVLIICIRYIKKIIDYTNYKNSFDKRLQKYQEDLEKYERKKKDYEESLKNYLISLKIYEKEKAEILSFQSIQLYKNKILTQEYKKIIPPQGNSSSVRKGVSESFFQKYLEDYEKDYVEYIFDEHRTIIEPALILNNISVVSEGKEAFPDLIYWDKTTNIIIDIEIDEPYVGFSGEPIHFSTGYFSHVDDSRDSVVLSKNWFVVRFSEEQIFQNPLFCAQYISAIFGYFRNGDFDYISDANKEDCILPSVKCWTKEDAIRMANARYRHSYIPKKYHHLLEIEDDFLMS